MRSCPFPRGASWPGKGLGHSPPEKGAACWEGARLATRGPTHPCCALQGKETGRALLPPQPPHPAASHEDVLPVGGAVGQAPSPHDPQKAQGPIFQKKQLLSQFCLQGGVEVAGLPALSSQALLREGAEPQLPSRCPLDRAGQSPSQCICGLKFSDKASLS